MALRLHLAGVWSLVRSFLVPCQFLGKRIEELTALDGVMLKHLGVLPPLMERIEHLRHTLCLGLDDSRFREVVVISLEFPQHAEGYIIVAEPQFTQVMHHKDSRIHHDCNFSQWMMALPSTSQMSLTLSRIMSKTSDFLIIP